MKTVFLVGVKAAGRVALVDDADYDVVVKHRWRVIEHRQRSGRGDGPYAMTTIFDGRRRDIYMHTMLTGWKMTDHSDGDGLNNQRSNLRPATTAQNNYNQSPQAGTSSRFKGVTWHKKRRKWQASIKVNGKFHYLGLFSDEEKAARAYADAAIATQGSYAYAARGAA
jgi:hypothetical protein